MVIVYGLMVAVYVLGHNDGLPLKIEIESVNSAKAAAPVKGYNASVSHTLKEKLGTEDAVT